MRRRSGAWELRVYLGPDPVTGKQRYRSRTVRAGKREAERVLAEMVAAASSPDAVVPTSVTVGELLEAWFELAVRDFSPKTARETRGFIDRNLVPGVGSVPLAKLTAARLDGFYLSLSESGGARGGPLAPATVRRIHGILRRALTQGVRWGWISSNPAAATSPPRVPRPDVRPPAPEDLSRVLRRATEESPELACYLFVAAATGARRSELVALRWSDVDLDDGVVSISRGIVMGPAGLVEKDTKTHSSRRVALDGRTVSMLSEHRELMVARAGMCGVELASGAFVFSHAADCSEPWFPDSVSRSFKRLCRAEGLDRVRLHDLRHFVATQLLGAGVDVRTVAGRLGHRNAATTLNVYSHFLQESDRAAATVIADILDEPFAAKSSQRRLMWSWVMASRGSCARSDVGRLADVNGRLLAAFVREPDRRMSERSGVGGFAAAVGVGAG